MNEKVKKVFELLGVEPNEEFEVMLKDNSKFSYKFKFDEDLQGYCFKDKWRLEGDLLRILLSGTYEIIKLPKEQKKKKLRDCTIGEILEHKYNQRIQSLICLAQSLLYLDCNTSYFKEFSMNDYFEKWIKPCIKDEILEIEVEE